ncbi:hypothetical protein JMA_29910 [Jeotgalibacillus malaysiensis]|uniref:Uncharacterized protein n=1 Tax=Jeotgalibacillus malaysiensis TaxID=1508404 RepID=A0A0B5AUM7_9BACL|nr:hypothetical protein [Jeotgalibacillus malaysiensis]AJD92308.1 hypothetical protein JMA_29910 [Jeotgalibacillus malaysiensis]
MNKYIKMAAGSLLAAALMVGCNVDDGMTGDNNNGALENPMNDNRDNNNRVDDDWGMDGDRNNDRNGNNNGTMNGDNNREDIIEDEVDREDRDKRDE